MHLAGLQAPVTVLRDELGIPYIFAANTPDLIRAQGFVTAQHRLLQMELYRATWRGELAATFGARALPSDIRMRVLGIRRNGERHAAKLDPAARAYLQQYVDGINGYLESHSIGPSARAQGGRPGAQALERRRPRRPDPLRALHACRQSQERDRRAETDRPPGLRACARVVPIAGESRLDGGSCHRGRRLPRAPTGPGSISNGTTWSQRCRARPPGTGLEQLGGGALAHATRGRRCWPTIRISTIACCPARGTRWGCFPPRSRPWAPRCRACPASWSGARSMSPSASPTPTATCRISTSKRSIPTDAGKYIDAGRRVPFDVITKRFA